MTGSRDPFDGQPYYCAVCGEPMNTSAECDSMECFPEAKATAEARQRRRRPLTTAAQPREQS